MQHPTPTAIEAIRTQLSAADSMLDHGLRAIHAGRRLDAMETVYAASCLIEEIVAALEAAPGCRNPDVMLAVSTAIAGAARSGR